MQRDVHFESDTHAQVVRLPDAGEPSANHIEIDDARFLFTAHFKKSGPDLILTGDDGRKLVVADYFNAATHPDLTSHGATLSGDLVAHLAGPDAPGHYAQAGAPAGAEVIGKCERMGGSATVQHANGVVENLNAGDAILKGDIVMTNDGSSLVLSLSDGTVFNMGASARMVLNELAYDANSNSNSALISLVKGSFTFVAGQVAHTGDMKVDTPVATMGIRGTTVNTNVDADINGNVYEVTYSLMTDPNGNVGAFQVLDRVTGAVIANVTSTGSVLNVTPAANFQVLAQETAKSPAQVQQELAAAGILFPVYQAVQAQTVMPPAPPQGPQGPQGPQQQQQQNTSPPGGSLNTAAETPQPAQETSQKLDINATVTQNGGSTQLTITSVTSNLPTTTNQPTTQTNPLTFLIQTPQPDQTPVVQHIPPELDATAPSTFLHEPGAGRPGAPTAVSNLALKNATGYDTAALAATGWINLGNGIYKFNGNFGSAILNTNNNTLSYTLNEANPAVLLLQPNQLPLTDLITVPVIGDGTSATTIAFTIEGTTHPVAQPGVGATLEDGSVSGKVIATDTAIIVKAPSLYTWHDGTSGDWANGANWSADPTALPPPPTGAANAAIVGTSVQTVTVAQSDGINSLTLNNPNATLVIGTGVVLTAYQGVPITAIQEIDITGGALVIGETATTIDNATINLSAGGALTSDGSVLTLGQHLTVNVTDSNPHNSIGSIAVIPALGGFGSIVNQGTINVGAGDVANLFGASIVNNGTITAPGTLHINARDFTNAGTITLGPSGDLSSYARLITQAP